MDAYYQPSESESCEADLPKLESHIRFDVVKVEGEEIYYSIIWAMDSNALLCEGAEVQDCPTITFNVLPYPKLERAGDKNNQKHLVSKVFIEIGTDRSVHLEDKQRLKNRYVSLYEIGRMRRHERKTGYKRALRRWGAED